MNISIVFAILIFILSGNVTLLKVNNSPVEIAMDEYV